MSSSHDYSNVRKLKGIPVLKAKVFRQNSFLFRVWRHKYVPHLFPIPWECTSWRPQMVYLVPGLPNLPQTEPVKFVPCNYSHMLTSSCKLNCHALTTEALTTVQISVLITWGLKFARILNCLIQLSPIM